MSRVRRVDLYPADFISGIVGQLTMEELGAYFALILFIYADGEGIENAADRLSGLFKKTRPKTVRAALDSLVAKGKVRVDVSQTCSRMIVDRCIRELQAACTRIEKASQNGSRGGRPSRDNNDLAKPPGLPPALQTEKLSTSPSPSSEERQEEDNATASLFPQSPSPSSAPPARRDGVEYAFEGKTIRVTTADFAAWKKAYSAIPDLMAELTSLDAWITEQPEAKRKTWFMSVSGMLNRRHQERKAELDKGGIDERTGLRGRDRFGMGG